MQEIFNNNNTMWETTTDELGNSDSNLVYVGSMEELAEETGLSVDKLYELLGEYEDDSRDLIDSDREIAIAMKGEY